MVRDCKLQGYFLPAEFVPGERPVGSLSAFDKWGEPWVSSARNCGTLGEPCFYHDQYVGRSINETARARPTPRDDQDGEDPF